MPSSDKLLTTVERASQLGQRSHRDENKPLVRLNELQIRPLMYTIFFAFPYRNRNHTLVRYSPTSTEILIVLTELLFSKRYVVISVRVNINTALGVKTITVTEEAYKMLAKEKKQDESFSEVIKRLTKERGKLSDSLGAWKMTDEEAQKFLSSLNRHWKKSTVRIRGKAEQS